MCKVGPTAPSPEPEKRPTATAQERTAWRSKASDWAILGEPAALRGCGLQGLKSRGAIQIPKAPEPILIV